MPSIRRLNTWFRKPPSPVINWGHPYSWGLIAAWTFHEGIGTPVELVNLSPPSANTGLSWLSSPDGGSSGSFNGSSTNLTYSAVPAVGPALSIAGQVLCTNTTSSGMIIERSNVNATWEIFTQSQELIYRGGSSVIRNEAAITNGNYNGKWFSWALTDTGVGTGAANGSTMYLNGLAQAAGGTSGNALAVSNTNAIHLGNYDASGFFLAGQIDYVYLWNYAIPAQQVFDISRNPWQIFQPALGDWTFSHTASATLFQPWIYGDQIEEMFG